jgi:Flp pilus assembly protein TadD
VEIALYQGVARLFLGNLEGAVERLTRAEQLADAAFAPDVSWYLAVAEERAGRREQARARLTALCAAGQDRSNEACRGVDGLK